MSTRVVTVKLLPEPADARALASTLKACNKAANLVSDHAFQNETWSRRQLHAACYRTIRDVHGLGSQAAVHVIRKVADAYNSGDRRWRRAAVRRKFRPMSAHPFDRRNLSIQVDKRTISITTTTGRRKNITYTAADWQNQAIVDHIERKGHIGESDLLWRRGAFYLALTIEEPDPELNSNPEGWIGVDLGIVNIATTSTGDTTSGNRLNQLRQQHLRTRRRLQKKGTRSAKRALARQRGRESRHSRNINHVISKKVVAEAQRTGHGIALEDLEGIRARARSRKPQRATLNSWSFHQLGTFITYKAARAGVPVVMIDPAYTSQTCHQCGNIDKTARIDRDTYQCTNPACSFVGGADENASHIIASRGAKAWAVSHAAKRHTSRAA